MVALLVASATACAGTRKAALREDFAAAPDVPTPVVTVTPAEPPVEPEVEAKQEPIQQQVSPEHVEAHVRAQVAQRMPGAATTTHRRVATTVLTESSRAGVDPMLVVALIHVESSFNPRARSRAGAFGLMQVRVPTLRQQLNRPKARRADALDPHTNVQAGVRYFRRLLDAFGATDLALMAYNAGPARIQRLLANGGIPPRIRDYSRKVGDELERIRNALLRPGRAERTQASNGDVPGLQAIAPSRPPS
ncbi:MAG: lytic transglycosylase domain-containing protein [Anaeromyxobacteraceae bacterium]